MSAVFNQAAFGAWGSSSSWLHIFSLFTGKHLEQPKVTPAYSMFKLEDLQSQTVRWNLQEQTH